MNIDSPVMMSFTADDAELDRPPDDRIPEALEEQEEEVHQHEEDNDGQETQLDDEDQDEDPFSPLPPPPRKRSRGSSCASSAFVPAAIRRQVITRANRKCWLCGQFGKHVAHVIAKADNILFEDYKQSRLLVMSSLHSIENLIFLCAGCHDAFDERVPVWTFLPQHLDALLLEEECFQTRRATAAARGIALPRLPTLPQNIPYVRYQIRRGHIFTQVFRKQRVKHWAGNPVAAMIRSASVLSGMQRLDPVTRCGIPDDVAVAFQRLLYLYGTRPPKVVGVQDDEDDADSLLGVDGEMSSTEEDGPPPEQRNPTLRKSHASKEPAPQETRPGQGDTLALAVKIPTPPMSGRKRRRVVEDDEVPEERWQFGPHMTADMVISWSRDIGA